MSSEPDSKRFDLRHFILVRHSSYHSDIESAAERKRSGKELIFAIFLSPHFNNNFIIKLTSRSYNCIFLVVRLPKDTSTRASAVAFASSN